MKVVYSKINCPGCVALKHQLRTEGIAFKEVIIGFDISREDFVSKYPDARMVPYVVEEDETT